MDIVEPVPVLGDNYAWLLVSSHTAAIVDPGEAAPVARILTARGLRLEAVLLTHHHHDHIGGAAEFAAAGVPVYGATGVTGVDRPVAEDDEVPVPGGSLRVLATPGHTRSGLCYRGSSHVFTGDTLFAAGCGRLLEGTPEEMQVSLARLAALPPDTAVCCGHEYTLANLAFAAAVEPENPLIAKRREEAAARRESGEPTVPSTVGLERETNPFLRWEIPRVRAAAERAAGRTLATPAEVFGALRRWKDDFRPA
jgi:hydroxyacylglutathione hydrolase